jgi:cytochrome bd-type quinol oxidase subunit 2
MYIHPVFLIIPVLGVAFLGGISFAIVGRGHRRAWMFVLPIIVIVWIYLGQLVSALVDPGSGSSNQLSASFLLSLLFDVSLPIVLCVAAWAFRLWRERGSSNSPLNAGVKTRRSTNR